MKITNEEAIEQLKRDAEYCKANPITCGDNAYKCYELAIEALEKAEKTDRPKGKWNKLTISNGELVGCVCSNCKFYVPSAILPSVVFDGYNFCPRCGADMRES